VIVAKQHLQLFSRIEILGSKRTEGHELDLSGSRDVIGHVTIRFPIGYFLIASSDSFSKRRIVCHNNTLQTTESNRRHTDATL